MKRSLLRSDRDGRGRRVPGRGRRRGLLDVESLEVRSLLSNIFSDFTKALGHPDKHAQAAAPAHVQAPRPKFTFPPYSITAEISRNSDPAGDGNIFQQNVLVDGYAPSNSTVWLAEGQRGYFTNVALADNTGHYAFLVPVPSGTSLLRVFAKNALQDYSNVATVNVTYGNPIVAWDSIALRAIANDALAAPEAARDLAILHAAQYDAVAAVEFPRAAYQVHVVAPRGASAEAAADAAAVTVLDRLFPSQSRYFTEAMNAARAGLPATRSVADGLELGRQVAEATLAARASDGSALAVNYGTTGRGPVAPFVLASGSQFRPPAPPTVGSPLYDQALEQVSALGRVDSPSRTQDQSDAAQFWNDGMGSFTNPGHWNEIAESLAVARKDTLARDARLFAQLDFALADAAIATWDAKATYNTPRPVAAIRPIDPTFTPLLSTPADPSYVSGHAAYGAAAADVLSASFGPHTAFTDRIFAVTGVTRTFPSLSAAARQDADSRTWGGVAFKYDARAGLALGEQVGRYVRANFPRGK